MPRPRAERTMRAAIIEAPGAIKVGDRPYPVLVEPTDAVVRVVLTCVCGGDLWQYRGESPFEPGPIGHEFVGVVEDLGSDVGGFTKGGSGGRRRSVLAVARPVQVWTPTVSRRILKVTREGDGMALPVQRPGSARGQRSRPMLPPPERTPACAGGMPCDRFARSFCWS